MSKIIDISEFNKTINFAKVKSNVEVVIMRLGYRKCLTGEIAVDTNFAVNLAGCKKYNIPFSMYFVTTAVTTLEAKQEAMFVADAAKKYMSSYPLPVFVDTETVKKDGKEGRSNALDRVARTAIIKEFCNTLQGQGVPAGIYAGANWLNTRLDMSNLPFSVWVADYTGACDYKGKYILWQYTSNGSVPGVPTRVDISKRANDSGSSVSTDTDTTTKTDTSISTSSSTADKNIEAVLAIAEAEVGYLEKKDGNLAYLYDKTANAGANNYTKYGLEMNQVYPRTMDKHASWCDAWVDWCIYKHFGAVNGAKVLYGSFDDYTINSAGYYKNAKAWHTSNPQKGDQIFFKNSSGVICHTGLVYNVDSKYVYTIEGNTSSAAGVVANGGCVRKKAYFLTYSRIAGYGRPNYGLNSSPVKDTKPTTNTGSASTIKIEGAESFGKSMAGTYTVNATSLNFRSGPGTDSIIISTLSRGTTVSCYGYYSTENGQIWLYVQAGSKVGYCSKKYLIKK